MKQSGWRKGHGIGRDLTGVSEPIEVEGQSPYCKKGLGLAYIYYPKDSLYSLYLVDIVGRSWTGVAVHTRSKN